MLKRIDVSRFSREVPGLGSRLRIVAISDLHPGTLSMRISELVDLINKQDADVVVFAGDIIDGYPESLLEPYFKEVQSCFAKLAVLGNHEYYRRKSVYGLYEFYTRCGFRLLVNQTIHTDGVQWVGLDDWVYGHPDVSILECDETGSRFVVWVSHSPVLFDRVVEQYGSPSLMIAGHTHGGQIALFGKTIFTPYGSGRYQKGWYTAGSHSLYVMRGIGTSRILPIRIGVKPEILVLDLLEQQQDKQQRTCK